MALGAVAPLCGQDIHPWLAGSGSTIYYNGGNVGIGTAAPGSTLHVNGAALIGSSASGGTNVTLNGGGPANTRNIGLYYNQANETGYFQVGYGGVSYNPLAINPFGGNVGIGTASPMQRLSVIGTLGLGTFTNTAPENNVLAINSAGTANHARLAMTAGAELGTGSSFTGLQFKTDVGALQFFHNTEAMRIASNGNVGIGTANPSQKLSVDGTIRTKEVVVDTGWADYVFEPAYRVRPLTEVNAYIQQHRRLPDMPSAEEAREKGVGLGEMQVKLLAKIEELTLQMIEMDRQNKELQARVAELESRRAQ